MLESDDTNHLVFPGHDTAGRIVRRLNLLLVGPGLAALLLVEKRA